MLRNSLLKLFFFTTVRKKRFLWILVAFTLLSAMLAYLGYLSFKNGLDYVPYEDMIYDTFNFTVVASIIFAGDLVSEDFGSNVKYILLQLGERSSLVTSKFLVSLFAVSLIGYLIPILSNLIVISVYKGLPNLEYIGILYLYVIAYTSLNSLFSALFYDKGSKVTIMVNIILWEIVYFIYSSFISQINSMKQFYYTSLPILAEGLYKYYYNISKGFNPIKPNLEDAILVPVIVTIIAVVATYIRVMSIKI
ncbi:hypothetical protein [Sulfurisphaera ohwakuensis]|uniref:Uncharacterized protein n=1 Tax=Sulfurisphaera ohwakuensis TaxID=69656 RepID=A0A650CFD8_SULOH|nr:hypothetical protein [Sulfurisphaera ohwakuensis]MBB5255097.1 hypothetical protein [Sulfurisphaera ohwakuensis]QGR16479.1 hypothetical protein D1869_04140 [Sulfurisphaera ohwakuensis]